MVKEVELRPKKPAEQSIEDAMKDTLGSLTKAIVLVLQSDGRDRFARAERLSKLATALQRQGSNRVGDLGLAQQAGEDYDVDGNYANGALFQGIRPAFNDQADVARQLMMQMGPMHAATTRTQRATELASLTQAKQSMIDDGNAEGAAIIEIRIKAILEQLKEGDDANGKASVVSADVLRRHPVGGGEGGGDDADLREAVALGGGVDADFARACGAAEVGPQAMGGPLRFPRPE